MSRYIITMVVTTDDDPSDLLEAALSGDFGSVEVGIDQDETGVAEAPEAEEPSPGSGTVRWTDTSDFGKDLSSTYDIISHTEGTIFMEDPEDHMVVCRETGTCWFAGKNGTKRTRVYIGKVLRPELDRVNAFLNNNKE